MDRDSTITIGQWRSTDDGRGACRVRERSEPMMSRSECLTRYRCAALSALAGQMPGDGNKTSAERCAEAVERYAHAMLAAEREPEAASASASPPSEEQIEAWIAEAMRIYRGNLGTSNPVERAIRCALTLAGVLGVP